MKAPTTKTANRAEPDADNEDDKAADRKDRGALVATDPLGRYLAEIRRFPLLSREEEAVMGGAQLKKDKDTANASGWYPRRYSGWW